MEITSAAFKDGGKIPTQHVMVAAGGKNLSIPLVWKNIPPGTKSFALSIIDPHPIAQNWVHWFVINISAAVTSLPEGASPQKMPPGAVELKNSFGNIGYGGPQPPKGSGEHPYVVTLHALDVRNAKPHPESVKRILNAFRLRPEEAVFVGDSEIDRRTAEAAEIRFIAYKNRQISNGCLIEDHREILKWLV